MRHLTGRKHMSKYLFPVQIVYNFITWDTFVKRNVKDNWSRAIDVINVLNTRLHLTSAVTTHWLDPQSYILRMWLNNWNKQTCPYLSSISFPLALKLYSTLVGQNVHPRGTNMDGVLDAARNWWVSLQVIAVSCHRWYLWGRHGALRNASITEERQHEGV